MKYFTITCTIRLVSSLCSPFSNSSSFSPSRDVIKGSEVVAPQCSFHRWFHDTARWPTQWRSIRAIEARELFAGISRIVGGSILGACRTKPRTRALAQPPNFGGSTHRQIEFY